MKVLPLPIKPPIWELASFKIDRAALRSRLGEPHYVEIDSSCTFGGEEDWWAYVASSGQRVVLTLRVPYQVAVILADPPDAQGAIAALSGAIGDSVVSVHDRPYAET